MKWCESVPYHAVAENQADIFCSKAVRAIKLFSKLNKDVQRLFKEWEKCKNKQICSQEVLAELKQEIATLQQEFEKEVPKPKQASHDL